MDIEVLGAWGELLGGASGMIAAIGVILTLLYLSRQIHQNTEQSRAQFAHQVMASLRDAMEPLTENSNADMYLRGLPGLENLSDVENFQFNVISAPFFRVFEEAYLHYHAPRLEEGYWHSITGQLRIVLRIPGVRQNWDASGDNYNSNFKRWGDSLVGA